MAAKQFTSVEWRKIRATLAENPNKYGFSERIYGSAVIVNGVRLLYLDIP